MESFIKFIMIIFNIFGLSILKLKDGKLEVSTFWRVVHFLKIIFVLIPIIYISSKSELINQFYEIENIEKKNSFENQDAINLIYIMFYKIDGYLILCLSILCGFWKQRKIVIFFKTIEKIQMSEDHKIKMVKKMKRQFAYRSLVILFGQLFIALYRKYDSPFIIIFGFLTTTAYNIFSVYALFVEFAGIYFVTFIEQILENSRYQDFWFLIEIISQFNDIFNKMTTIVFIQIFSNHTLKVSTSLIHNLQYNFDLFSILDL